MTGRVTVFHLTRLARLPLIEIEGLRTRADLSDRYGPPGLEDEAAPGRYSNGRRISAYLSEEHARSRSDEHGPGLVSFTVDPKKSIAAPSSARGGDPSAYWEAARGLDEWLTGGDAPDDLEVHQNVPVRTKHLRLHAPIVVDEDLAPFGPVVEAIADIDRLAAKAMMHLLIIASGGQSETPAFRAAAALAWRDEPDPDRLGEELVRRGPAGIAAREVEALETIAPDAAKALRDALDDARAWGEAEGFDEDQAVLLRSGITLDEVKASA
jgi:hypothetical protein